MITLNINWGDTLFTALSGVLMVFVVLAILVLSLVLLSNILTYQVNKKNVKSGAESGSIKKNRHHVPAGDTAAIAMALHLYLNDFHEEESNVITIKRIERRYSPWSSKIYGINTFIK